MDRLFTSVLTDDVSGTAQFYETVFGMTRHFDADWFVILTHPQTPGLEFGVLDLNSTTVPDEARTSFGGAMVTMVVKDCDQSFTAAKQAGAAVVETPRLMPYGQRRALVRDPAGTLIDISSPQGEIEG
ncbi:MAG: VOC family protein [Pseudomonadota bacterium]